MKVRMADLWRPVKGVTIKEAKTGLFLFSFAHPLDMEAVLNGGPWTFDNNMLIVDRVQLGMQIENIALSHATLWVQIHNLPAGLMKETVGVKLGNYIGNFMEYDKNNNSSFWRQYMRVRVKIDVRQPLKKDTKVKDREGNWCTVNFKYEKLGIFCFVCGVMGHAENKCEVRFSMENDDGRREWSGDIRAEQRRGAGRQTSRWLREERVAGDSLSGGARGFRGESTLGTPSMGSTHADVELNSQDQPFNTNNALVAHKVNSLLHCQSSSHSENSSANPIGFPLFQTETDNDNQSRRQPSVHNVTENSTNFHQIISHQIPSISATAT
jgi:14-3-3 protein epsilon